MVCFSCDTSKEREELARAVIGWETDRCEKLHMHVVKPSELIFLAKKPNVFFPSFGSETRLS